jgi:hypothetical protein
MNLDALLVERLKLEEIGLKHIDTFEKLTKFYKGFHDFLLSKNPYIRKKAGYSAYRYQVRMYILGLLRNFTCEHCNKIDLKRSLHFHHVNPETKRFRISRIGSHSLIKGLKESLKCIYLCDECHYKEHLKMGDYYGYFETIDRWRHPYLQNLLGSTDSSTLG